MKSTISSTLDIKKSKAQREPQSLNFQEKAWWDLVMPSSTPELTLGRAPVKPAPTSLSRAIPGCPLTTSVVRRQTMPCCSGQIRRPLFWRKVPHPTPAPGKVMSVFAGESWSPPELGLPCVPLLGCAHRNTGKSQQTHELKQDSILDAMANPSFLLCVG